jgi:uncharacterized protein (TIGR02145 family)
MKITAAKILLELVIFSFIIHACRKEQEEVPTLITDVTNVRAIVAWCSGTITDYGSGEVRQKGVCWSTASRPTMADHNMEAEYENGNSFYCMMNNLQPRTKYYARVFAINNAGIGYGNEISFSTSGAAPGVRTLPATNLGLHSATLNGTVNANYLNTNVSIEYGQTINYGSEITIIYTNYYELLTPNFSDSFGIMTYVTGLIEGTTYHYRIKAVNSLGTTYGNDVTFTTSYSPAGDIVLNPDLTYGSVSDIDGNNYKTIQIGTQLWMAENLRVTKFNDGTPLVKMPLKDNSYTSYYGYSYYNNDSDTYWSTYGTLYNWQTVDKMINGSKNICPSGWHVPDDAEWDTLADYLGGITIAGGKLKETGTTHWISPNTRANNMSGFSALPGGLGWFSGTFFMRIGEMGYWWSSTNFDTYGGWIRVLYKNNGDIGKITTYGGIEISIRCIKD